MKIVSLILVSAAILYSCDKKEATSKEDSAVIAAQNNSSKIPISNADETPVAANTSSDKPALNPEHGQPYHRCEIPVGEPIDSAPPQDNAPQVVPQQSAANSSFNTNPISPSLAPSSAPPKVTGIKPTINPAHGEPHHRCDLEVGAPLI